VSRITDSYTDNELAAARIRRQFQLELNDYREILGRGNFGDSELLANGVVKLYYVNEEPRGADLPKGFHYVFERTDLTYDEMIAEKVYVPDPSFRRVGNPGEAHKIQRAGHKISIECGSNDDGEPEHHTSGIQETETGTITAMVTWKENDGDRVYGAMTAGHDARRPRFHCHDERCAHVECRPGGLDRR